MSEVQSEQVTSGTNSPATSGATAETSGSVEGQRKQETVSAEHALKLKKELENWRSKAKELEMKTLEAEGQKDKIIEVLRAENDSIKKTQAEMLRSKVRDQVAMKAQEMGCVDPDLMLKAIDVDQFEVDPGTLRITNSATLLETLEGLRKSKPYMFKQAGPSIKDGVPVTKPNTKVDLSKMSKAELVAYAQSKGIK
jgi:small-conductance mechanosensitive channel